MSISESIQHAEKAQQLIEEAPMQENLEHWQALNPAALNELAENLGKLIATFDENIVKAKETNSGVNNRLADAGKTLLGAGIADKMDNETDENDNRTFLSNIFTVLEETNRRSDSLDNMAGLLALTRRGLALVNEGIERYGRWYEADQRKRPAETTYSVAEQAAAFTTRLKKT